MVRLKPLIKGALSFALPPLRSTGGRPELSTANADFCYSLFLRHLSYVSYQFAGTVPPVVAELGPGSSIGVGLAALIAGARTYFALDVQNHMAAERNLIILRDLVSLFRHRTAVPRDGRHETTFPEPLTWDFPPGLQPDLSDNRLAAIESEIQRGGGEMIQIAVPWARTHRIAANSVDWLWSHSCLEHVDDVASAFKSFRHWLKPGGMMTHEIDYRSHNLTTAWDGHWAVGDLTWGVMRGRRSYLINRLPHSFYRDRLIAVGFEMVAEVRFDILPVSAPLDQFVLTDLDRHTAMAFFVCRKR